MPVEATWIDIFKALLTPAIGILAIVIAFQQWRTNRNKLKLELFDKRFAVFQATRSFLSSVLRDGRVTHEALETYRLGIIDSVFLLDSATSEFLWGLYKTGLAAIRYNSSLEGVPVGEKRSQLVSQETAEVKKLTDEIGNLQNRFEKFLKLAH